MISSAAYGEHAVLGPAPVKESICWVLNTCTGNNERYGNASWVRVRNGWGYGAYIVDGRLVVLGRFNKNYVLKYYKIPSPMYGDVSFRVNNWLRRCGSREWSLMEVMCFLVESTYNVHSTLPSIDCHTYHTLEFSVHGSSRICSLIVEHEVVWSTTLHDAVHELINMCLCGICYVTLVDPRIDQWAMVAACNMLVITSFYKPHSDISQKTAKMIHH